MKELTESSGVTLDGERVFLIVVIIIAFAWFCLREVRTPKVEPEPISE